MTKAKARVTTRARATKANQRAKVVTPKATKAEKGSMVATTAITTTTAQLQGWNITPGERWQRTVLEKRRVLVLPTSSDITSGIAGNLLLMWPRVLFIR